MFEPEDIREWCGHKVLDADGNKIGDLEAVYVDTKTDQPAFATVKVGMMGRARLVFVPLATSTLGPGYLKVNQPKKLVKDAPSIALDGELLAGDEPAVFHHYSLEYDAGPTERRLARR